MRRPGRRVPKTRRSLPACWPPIMRPTRGCGSMSVASIPVKPCSRSDANRLEGAAGALKTLNLSARADLIEAAANLFSHLRTLDAAGAPAIAVMRVPHEGLGEAINDRLRRAATPR